VAEPPKEHVARQMDGSLLQYTNANTVLYFDDAEAEEALQEAEADASPKLADALVAGKLAQLADEAAAKSEDGTGSF